MEIKYMLENLNKELNVQQPIKILILIVGPRYEHLPNDRVQTDGTGLVQPLRYEHPSRCTIEFSDLYSICACIGPVNVASNPIYGYTIRMVHFRSYNGFLVYIDIKGKYLHFDQSLNTSLTTAYMLKFRSAISGDLQI